MERDFWYTSSRRLADLESPEDVGREAARRAVRRLGGRKGETMDEHRDKARERYAAIYLEDAR